MFLGSASGVGSSIELSCSRCQSELAFSGTIPSSKSQYRCTTTSKGNFGAGASNLLHNRFVSHGNSNTSSPRFHALNGIQGKANCELSAGKAASRETSWPFSRAEINFVPGGKITGNVELSQPAMEKEKAASKRSPNRGCKISLASSQRATDGAAPGPAVTRDNPTGATRYWNSRVGQFAADVSCGSVSGWNSCRPTVAACQPREGVNCTRTRPSKLSAPGTNSRGRSIRVSADPEHVSSS